MKSQEESLTSSEDFDLFAEFDPSSTGVATLPEPPSKIESLPTELNEATRGLFLEALKELYKRVEELEKSGKEKDRKIKGLALMYQKLKDKKEEDSFKPMEEHPPEPQIEDYRKDCPKCGGSGHVTFMVKDPLYPGGERAGGARCECFQKYEEDHAKWFVEDQKVSERNGKRARRQLKNINDAYKLKRQGANGATT